MRNLKVTVIDGLMGCGKTTAAIDMMRDMCIEIEAEENGDKQVDGGAPRFVYLTPFLDEVARVKAALPDYKWLIKDPKTFQITGRDQNGEMTVTGKRKLDDFNDKLRDGKCIVSTHQLFALTDGETAKALQNFRYVLFIDEVADWVERYKIHSDDAEVLLDAGVLRYDPTTGRVSWIDKPPRVLPNGKLQARYSKGVFAELRRLCLTGKIVGGRVRADDDASARPTLLLWKFPVEMLKHFELVCVFTHLFEGSDMSAYFKLHRVEVDKKTIAADKKTIIDYDPELEMQRVAALRPLVTIIGNQKMAAEWPGVNVLEHSKLNAIGRRRGRQQPFGHTWLKNAKADTLKTIKDNLKNLFTHLAPVPSNQALWSTYEFRRHTLTGNGYGRGFLACNARATNDHRERTVLAYCVNLHHHPHIYGYFRDAGVEVSEDFFALMQMLQWIFRSAIRDGQQVVLWIPSERMRDLFLNWLHGRLPEGNSSQPDDSVDDEEEGDDEVEVESIEEQIEAATYA